MKRATALLASVILLVSMLVLGVGSTTQAQARCSLASFRGAYGAVVTGFFQQSGPPVASNPYAAVGLITADGAGGFTGTLTESSNGNIQPIAFTGTYTVNSDCTGSLFVPGPQGGTVNFVIVARGSQLLFLAPAPGSVQSGIGIRQEESRCSLASFQGTYGAHITGFFQQSGPGPASNPYAAIGLVTADGAGSLSATITESSNGTIRSFVDTGTYTVNPDCTGSVTVTSGGTFYFVIVARGSRILVIATIPGAVQAGSLILTAPAALPISTLTTIDVPGSTETDAAGINNPGQIAGHFMDPDGRDHGFLLAGGNITTMDVPGSVATFARGINDRGQVVGNYVDSTGKRRGFLLSGGNFTTIDFPGAVETRATGINNPGVIVGRYVDSGAIVHAFLFAGGSFMTIDPPGSANARAQGINDLGQVVGRFRDPNGVHGFLLSGGVFTALDFPGAPFTEALGVNNRGEIVGDYEDSAEMVHGFVLSGGIFRTMDVPGAIETFPPGINDVGQIVGSYTDSTERTHGFLVHR